MDIKKEEVKVVDVKVEEVKVEEVKVEEVKVVDVKVVDVKVVDVKVEEVVEEEVEEDVVGEDVKVVDVKVEEDVEEVVEEVVEVKVVEVKVENKGTGAGGYKTNTNGLPYEKKTELNIGDRYKHKGSFKLGKKDIMKVSIDGISYTKLQKGELKKYMMLKKKYNTKSEKSLQPDECYLDEENRIINVIEKKFQQGPGSCDEKIQTGPFKRWFYKEQYPDYEIRYCYCLSDWFKSDKYKPEMRYLKDYNIKVFWGKDDNYQNNIMDWILNN
tara:strand:+ start:82 stop:891 length:810 start_codon:yes stop_codon:yes gene_type:complete